MRLVKVFIFSCESRIDKIKVKENKIDAGQEFGESSSSECENMAYDWLGYVTFFTWGNLLGFFMF